jgi:2',3'-cyclic-nucleotide 2'-phosphodiesterase
VQTADDEILPQGTAYLSDVGMTGPFDSVIGVKKDAVIERFLTMIPNKFEVAKADVRMQAALLDIDSKTGKANSIERISIKLKE